VVGHSLGGLVAFRALSGQPAARVFHVATVDSPLGGAPPAATNICIDAGFCTSGPIVDDLAQLYGDWSRTATENTVRDLSRAADYAEQPAAPAAQEKEPHSATLNESA